ncbi:PqqD family protein [Streptomyces triculaminicus]|uniref:PqqD family protein n=2 Tax=Streptomyces TaxID=1883 RepID=A0A939FS51_9ACTN|nr:MULTISPECIES: hypothetical protein [Streptomyces]MBO0656357.1 PqqD family protein [Streptomyces triculaminicus]QSY50345.1 PqqD family protein [Streptomyces griseocarneus]
MRSQPAPGVSVNIGTDGCLELRSDSTVRPGVYRWAPVCTAMWIALRQHDGDVDAAARTLASQWGTAPTDTRADLGIWVDELRDAGLAY